MNSISRVLPMWKQHLNSIVYALLCLAAATVFSLVYRRMIPEEIPNIYAVYLLAVVIISRYTANYIYGITFSLISVILIKIFFAYPQEKVGSALAGDLMTFGLMAVAAVLICSMKSGLNRQADVIREREKQLSEAEIEKLRANLLRAISHDLRTPLTGIIGNSSLILESGESLSEKEKTELLANIYEDSNWLLNMVENLLTVTRIKGDNLAISTSEEPVEEVIAEALQRIKKRYPEAKVNVKIPEKLLLILMDAILIEQVLINLVGNAVEHSGSTEPIDLSVRDTPHAVVFTVRDYGAGIGAGRQEELFDGAGAAFSRAADAYKGMGIGLSICKTIITAHHGTIIGRNHERGAEFIFTLPKQ